MDLLYDKVAAADMQHLEEIARDFLHINGVLKWDTANNAALPVATSLHPSPFPQKYLNLGIKLQKYFNELYHKAACDHEFLASTLQKVVEQDDYMRHLWSIYTTVREEGLAQPIFLGLNRSDYMVHVPCVTDNNAAIFESDDGGPSSAWLKQVEFNLMASSFGGLSQQLCSHHRRMLQCLGFTREEADARVPVNTAADGLAHGLATAWRFYERPAAAILFVVTDAEGNRFDQRILEQSIYSRAYGITVLRRSFEALKTQASLREERRLYVGETEIAVVYYRNGYVPQHFPDEETWAVKLLMERSKAIKCPCIQYMLVNTKRIQQSLTEPGVLERFLPDQTTADLVASTFVDQFVPGEREDKVQEALSDSDEWVLKPQREGGGNNYYREHLRQKLSSLVDDEAHQYILMKRIRPFTVINSIVPSRQTATHGAEVNRMRIVSELGVFGVYIGSGTNELANYECGHLLRSKPEQTDEGGIAAGYGCLDSPYLLFNTTINRNSMVFD